MDMMRLREVLKEGGYDEDEIAEITHKLDYFPTMVDCLNKALEHILDREQLSFKLRYLKDKHDEAAGLKKPAVLFRGLP